MSRTTCFLTAFCLLSWCAGCVDGPGRINSGGETAAVPVVIDPEKDSPDAQPVGSPGEAVVDFHDGMQSGDLKHAMPFVLIDSDADEKDRRANYDRLRSICQQMAEDVYDFRVVGFREDGDCAIVIVQDTIVNGVRQQGRGPTRNFFLMRQSGLWKVLPRVTTTAGTPLTRDQRDAFIRLVEWAADPEASSQ